MYNPLDSYWEKDTHINLFLLLEANIEDKKLLKVKQKTHKMIYILEVELV